MKYLIQHINRMLFVLTCCVFSVIYVNAQTDADAIMMTKNNFCVGGMYNYSSWKNYWEGTHKRDNANLGTVSTQMFAVMGNYGLSNKVNLLFGVPYVKTKASAGQLHGMKGMQDAAVWIKYMPLEKPLGKGTISLYTIGGFSFPVSGYTPDFLPMSIGLHSRNFSFRGMADYQIGSWFVTASATYVLRSNVKLFRDAYYTTEMHYTNEVRMPDASQVNLRAGYRNSRLIAEALLSQWKTLGGFDITKNNMPFASNKMNMTAAGINVKYNLKKVDGLSLIGGGSFTLAGRNVGQANGFNAGVFYIIDFSNKQKTASSTNKTN